jgi:hypothetical protein
MRIALRSPHDEAMHSTHPEMGHGLRYRLRMFRKQVTRGPNLMRGFPRDGPARMQRTPPKCLVTGPIRVSVPFTVLAPNDAGEKEQGRSADQERHTQEDRRPEQGEQSAHGQQPRAASR